jgi:hypothetical protein
MSELQKDCKSSKSDQDQDHIPKFIKTLYQILEDKDCSEYISWSQDGRAIVIKKPTEFAESLLPVYFKHSNFSSFVRQLNLYNFRKKKRYPFDNTFAHTMFLKGRMDLLKLVKRKNNSGNQTERVSLRVEPSVDTSRDFDELIGQNMCLKKVHQDMNEKIKTLEGALKDLSSENQTLQVQYRKKKQNEEILKQVITKVAKIYGAIPIKEIVDSISSQATGTKLNWNSRSSFQGKRSEANRFQGGASRNHFDRNMVSHGPQHYGYGFDDDLPLKNNLPLSNPFIRTVSSVSTNPEINHSFDFYQDFDEKCEQDLNREISYSQVFSLKAGNAGAEEPAYFAEAMREPYQEASKSFCDTKSYDLNPSSSLEEDVFMN